MSNAHLLWRCRLVCPLLVILDLNQFLVNYLTPSLKHTLTPSFIRTAITRTKKPQLRVCILEVSVMRNSTRYHLMLAKVPLINTAMKMLTYSGLSVFRHNNYGHSIQFEFKLLLTLILQRRQKRNSIHIEGDKQY